MRSSKDEATASFSPCASGASNRTGDTTRPLSARSLSAWAWRMYALKTAPSPLALAIAFSVVSTTHFASRGSVAASTGPGMTCSTRPSGAQK